MNYFHELVTIVLHEGFLSFKMHYNLLVCYKLYYQCDLETNTTSY